MDEDARGFGLSLMTVAIMVTGLLVLAALVLWPLGRLALVVAFGKGLLAVFLASLLVMLAGHAFIQITRRDPTDIHSRSFGVWTVAHLASGVGIMVGWAFLVARPVGAALTGLAWWQGALVVAVGLLATLIAENVAGEVFTGRLYRLVNPIAGFTSYGGVLALGL